MEQIENNNLLRLSICDESRANMTDICAKLTKHEPMSTSLPACRRPACTMYLVGGYQRESLKLNEKFNFNSKTWHQCVQLDIARSGN